MFRINSIKFHNFRNILDSEIFLNTAELQTSLGGSVVGIYGANGSSKSSVGYGLCLFDYLICGISSAFFHNFNNDFGISDSVMWLEYDFSFDTEKAPFVGAVIRFDFKKENDNVYLSNESVTFKDGNKGRPITYTISRNADELSSVVINNDYKKIAALFNIDEKAVVSILINSIKDKKSFFFGLNNIEFVLKQNKSDSEEDNFKLIYLATLMHYIVQNKVVIMPDSYGMSIMNSLFVYYGSDDFQLFALPVDKKGSLVANDDQINKVQKVVDSSNRFLQKIIKDFKVELYKELLETTSNGVKKYKVKFFSVKNHGRFPFENESEGIKRLFLIATSISRCMNEDDYIVFVDEFDEGIFEVLFGDTINSLYKQCMGQFIFTSHNLRPLEVMKYTNFIFSTLNPTNRFVTLKGIKPGNNLRDIYIRKIMYGNDCELSNQVDSNDLLEGLVDGTI